MKSQNTPRRSKLRSSREAAIAREKHLFRELQRQGLKALKEGMRASLYVVPYYQDEVSKKQVSVDPITDEASVPPGAKLVALIGRTLYEGITIDKDGRTFHSKYSGHYSSTVRIVGVVVES